MLKNQSFPVYVLNLDRSKDRWDSMVSEAESYKIILNRVEAVEGRLLSSVELQHYDDEAFRRNHGKIVLPAEIGCYLSHLKVLEIIASSEDDIAVILEDDIRFTDKLLPFLNQISAVSGWDVIKMVNHRTSLFLPHYKLSDEVMLGRCMHGPLGSSAAYVVTRDGARKLLKALRPMALPYDVALERGWAGNYKLFLTKAPLVTLAETFSSTVVEQGAQTYVKNKLRWWKRINTFFFRSQDYIRRATYAIKKTHLKIMSNEQS